MTALTGPCIVFEHPRSARETRIRSLAGSNPTIAAALELVDRGQQSYPDALECLVLELAQRHALPARDDDGHCLGCMELDCRCPGGAA